MQRLVLRTDQLESTSREKTAEPEETLRADSDRVAEVIELKPRLEGAIECSVARVQNLVRTSSRVFEGVNVGGGETEPFRCAREPFRRRVPAIDESVVLEKVRFDQIVPPDVRPC